MKRSTWYAIVGVGIAILLVIGIVSVPRLRGLLGLVGENGSSEAPTFPIDCLSGGEWEQFREGYTAPYIPPPSGDGIFTDTAERIVELMASGYQGTANCGEYADSIALAAANGDSSPVELNMFGRGRNMNWFSQKRDVGNAIGVNVRWLFFQPASDENSFLSGVRGDSRVPELAAIQPPRRPSFFDILKEEERDGAANELILRRTRPNSADSTRHAILVLHIFCNNNTFVVMDSWTGDILVIGIDSAGKVIAAESNADDVGETYFGRPGEIRVVGAITVKKKGE